MFLRPIHFIPADTKIDFVSKRWWAFSMSILLLLQTRGRMTAHTLAEHLEVSERTIYRDFDALSAAGVPIYVDRGRNGGCTLVDGYRTDLTGLSNLEARTLFAMQAQGHLSDLGLARAGAAAVDKLLAALPAMHRGEAYQALAANCSGSRVLLQYVAHADCPGGRVGMGKRTARNFKRIMPW